MRLVRRCFLAVLVAYALALGALVLLQRNLQFNPSHNALSPAEAGFEGVQQHVLTAADGTKIVLWYAPPPPGAATILYFHGKGGEIGSRPTRWAAYRDAGFGVAFLSYRGYGGSEGSPSEAGFHMDADAAHDWLLAQGVASDRLALVGESLGTGVAVRLAADRPVGALLLEAPYTSVADVAARRYSWAPVHWLIRDPFPSLDRIPRVTAPLLVQHGTEDSRIPVEMAKTLFAAAQDARSKEIILWPGLDHLQLFGPKTWAAEVGFLNRVVPPL